MMEKSTNMINPHPGRDELTMLFAGESVTMPQHYWGPQVVDYYLIHIVTSGNGTFQCRGKTYSLKAGDSFFIFPGELVRYEADAQTPWCYRWISLQGELAPALMERIRVTPDRPIIYAEDHEPIVSLYKQAYDCLKQGSTECDLQASAFARLIMAAYMKLQPKEEKKTGTEHSLAREQIEHAVRYMSLQYYQPIVIDEMAAELGYHRTHFSKMFKQVIGVSPYQFLTNIRMKKAIRLLKEPLSIQEIATSVGYQDPLYFSKQFKKIHGLSPREYRRRIAFKNDEKNHQ